ncbi:hypothetical protein ANANG_G00261330 [Anguilla anguilla]|uniref:Uncharacterized protein n=1 Tax=Anguilla anguilla TaxID=7936 RepID=A0A9D3LPH4_ANGAN|nr:hypothetical protein ANANG_G00261330 [Anguilla anguilla]
MSCFFVVFCHPEYKMPCQTPNCGKVVPCVCLKSSLLATVSGSCGASTAVTHPGGLHKMVQNVSVSLLASSSCKAI